MRRKAFIRKMKKEIMKVDCTINWLACMNLNTLECKIARAVMEGIINLDDYKELISITKEMKNKLMK